jgi:hypothetical protein
MFELNYQERLEGLNARKDLMREATDQLLELYKDQTKREQVTGLLKQLGVLQKQMDKMSQEFEQIAKEIERVEDRIRDYD